MTLVKCDQWYLLGKGKTRESEPLYGAQILTNEMRDSVPIAEAEHDANQAIALCIAAFKAAVALEAQAGIRARATLASESPPHG